jgi:hypothetical protein
MRVRTKKKEKGEREHNDEAGEEKLESEKDETKFMLSSFIYSSG